MVKKDAVPWWPSNLKTERMAQPAVVYCTAERFSTEFRFQIS